MGLRRATGNMYEDVDYLWSALVGGCEYQCKYCYAKKEYERWATKKYNLGNWCDIPKMSSDWDKKGRFRIKFPYGSKIFVCHTTDMFSPNVPKELKTLVFEQILVSVQRSYMFEKSQNIFQFQSKNPLGIISELDNIDDSDILGTTIETNRDTKFISLAPVPEQRHKHFCDLMETRKGDYFVTIEPIMDFDPKRFVEMFEAMAKINPLRVYVGADSKHNKLPEPDKEKTMRLINTLDKFCDVKLKYNIQRIIGRYTYEKFKDRDTARLAVK